MKSKILLISLILFICFCLVVLFKGLNNSNVYIPDTTNKIVNEFIEKFPKMKNIGNKIKSEFKTLSIFKKFEECGVTDIRGGRLQNFTFNNKII